LNLEIQFEQILNNLKVLTGVDPGTDFILTTDLEHDPVAYNVEEVVETVQSQNAQIVQARINEEIALVDVQLRKNARSPTLQTQGGLQGAYSVFTADFPVSNFGPVPDYQLPTGVDATSNFTWGDFAAIQQAQIDAQNQQILNPGERQTESTTQTGYNYGPYINFTLNVPLWDAGTRKRAIANAEVSRRIAENRRVLLEDQQEANVRSALVQYNKRLTNIQLAIQALDAANLLLNYVRDRYRSGVVNSFEFRQAQVTYENAAVAYNQSVFAAIEAYLLIERLKGSIVNELTE
jgi:outer membrane protein TolC